VRRRYRKVPWAYSRLMQKGLSTRFWKEELNSIHYRNQFQRKTLINIWF